MIIHFWVPLGASKVLEDGRTDGRGQLIGALRYARFLIVSAPSARLCSFSNSLETSTLLRSRFFEICHPARARSLERSRTVSLFLTGPTPKPLCVRRTGFKNSNILYARTVKFSEILRPLDQTNPVDVLLPEFITHA